MWPGIAHHMFVEKGIVRDVLLRCERLVQAHINQSLESIGGIDQIAKINAVEPLLTSVQIALTEGWRERGIVPDVIAGRSGGEVAAEYARGTLTLQDAIEVACRTSHLMSTGSGAGRMLVVELGLEDTEKLKLISPVEFTVAADASDAATVVSCETSSVKTLEHFLRSQHIEHHGLRFDIAPHGPILDEWKSFLLQPLSGRERQDRRIKYYSAAADGPDEGTAYKTRLWDAVRKPAYMGRVLQNLLKDGCNTFVEVGGQPLLGAMIERRASAMGKTAVVLPSMRRGDGASRVMNESERSLREAGVPLRPERVGKKWSGLEPRA
jgi:hybrid polyketide synthase/nonribosomal peptide synthetase FtdB